MSYVIHKTPTTVAKTRRGYGAFRRHGLQYAFANTALPCMNISFTKKNTL